MNKGKVYLVGAGPGDPGLLTLKGLDCLKKADVIVYDRLAADRFLSYAKPEAKLIYAGKAPQEHTLDQSRINALLVEEARAGRLVVRLKGGDPFVFGRGGEEAEALQEAGLPFEIVPGITSAVAVPAYAGIPVTHRDYTSTFTVVTGHEDPDKYSSAIDWARLASDQGTLVFLMGVRNLSGIIQNLLAHGKDPHTPVALISKGTLTEQHVVSGVLADIEKKVQEQGLTHPAVIVIGDVVGLRDKLAWREYLPLFGKRVLVTRAREQAGEFSAKIEELGGEAVEYPAITIRPLVDYSRLDQAIREAAGYDWIIFTSVNGVRSFFQRMRQLGLDIRSLGPARLAAIGPKTAQALEDKGLIVSVLPEKFRAESVLDALRGQLLPGQRVLLPRANLARPLLADCLKEWGLVVDEVTAYLTERAAPDNRYGGSLPERIKRKEFQLITFTSSSTVRNFAAILKKDIPAEKDQSADKKDVLAKMLAGTVIACIGPITAATAEEEGLRADIVAEDYTIEGLVQAIVRYYGKEEKGDR